MEMDSNSRVMNKWIETKALFLPPKEDNDISELIGKEPELQWDLFAFNIEKLIAVNISERKGCSVIRFEQEQNHTIDMPYDRLIKIITDYEDSKH